MVTPSSVDTVSPSRIYGNANRVLERDWSAGWIKRGTGFDWLANAVPP